MTRNRRNDHLVYTWASGSLDWNMVSHLNKLVAGKKQSVISMRLLQEQNHCSKLLAGYSTRFPAISPIGYLATVTALV